MSVFAMRSVCDGSVPLNAESSDIPSQHTNCIVTSQLHQECYCRSSHLTSNCLTTYISTHPWSAYKSHLRRLITFLLCGLQILGNFDSPQVFRAETEL